MLALLEHLRDPARAAAAHVRPRRDGKVVLVDDAPLHDVPIRDAGTPTYAGLPLDRYVSLFEMLNPMHRLWSDGRWNKLTIAHGCYWKQCTFCDVTLDYIARYERAPADLLVDRIEAIVAETGQTGFHFVDEAAPPAALEALAEAADRARRRDHVVGQHPVREGVHARAVQAARALAAASRCRAGSRSRRDRLLELMKKGVTVEQVARVTRAFTDAGVMVHAYLMYGFPTETAQDTVDALERVRQLFAEGCVQSAFWHRFTATAHSPIGKQPELFGITLRKPPAITFAKNDVAFDDPTGLRSRSVRRWPAQGGLQLHARPRPRRRSAHVVSAPRQGPEGYRPAGSGAPRARSLAPASGIRITIRVPRPRSEVTAMVPPHASMIRRTIESPSPVPAIELVRCARKNGSNMCAASSRRHPEPVVGHRQLVAPAHRPPGQLDRRRDVGPAVLERVLAEVPQDLVQQAFAAAHGRRLEVDAERAAAWRTRVASSSAIEAATGSVRPVALAVTPIRDSSSSSSTRVVICSTPRWTIPVTLACCGARSPSRSSRPRPR